MGRLHPPAWTRRRWLQAAPAWAALPAAQALQAGGPPIAWPALVTVQGQALPPSHWQGVPAVVVFWATWCAFCRRHNAHVEALFRSVDPQRLRVLGVALDTDLTLVRRHLQQTGYSFPTVADGGALRTQFTARRVIPMTCTVGADGRLLQALPGEMAADDVRGLAALALPPR